MAVTNYYTVNGRIIGESANGVRTDYLCDALGSVTATVDQSANVLNTYRYKPYGGLLSKAGTGEDPEFLWNGRNGYRSSGRPHAERYVRARHYSELDGTWTSRDRFWPRERNLTYVGSNPSLQVDPSGNVFCKRNPINCKWLKLVAPQATGLTYCCTDGAGLQTIVCADACQQHCTAQHEGVHASQERSCCNLAVKCYANSKTFKDQAVCDSYYEEWMTRNASAFECEAYAASSQCFETMALIFCANFGGRPKPGTSVNPSDPCCGEYDEQAYSDDLMMTSSCADAGMTRRKNHRGDYFDCPFDPSGRPKPGWM